MVLVSTTTAPTETGFFGSVDPLILNTLPVGAVVEVEYDSLGSRRDRFRHTVTGTVRRVLPSSDRGEGMLHLEQVRVVRGDGEVFTKPTKSMGFRDVMAVRMLEGFGA